MTTRSTSSHVNVQQDRYQKHQINIPIPTFLESNEMISYRTEVIGNIRPGMVGEVGAGHISHLKFHAGLVGSASRYDNDDHSIRSPLWSLMGGSSLEDALHACWSLLSGASTALTRGLLQGCIVIYLHIYLYLYLRRCWQRSYVRKSGWCAKNAGCYCYG